MLKQPRILFIFSPGDTLQGGLHRSILNALLNGVKSLNDIQPKVDLLAPENSELENSDISLICVDGNLHEDVGSLPKDIYPIPVNGYLSNALHYAKSHEDDYDAIINLSHDWLPYYLTPYFNTPLLHRANVANENEVVTNIIQTTAKQFPNRVAAISHFQANSLGIKNQSFLLSQGIDLSAYPYVENVANNALGFFSRIRAEKGLEDAAIAAKQTGHTLICAGNIDDESYFSNIMNNYNDVIDYRGFLDKEELVKTMGECKALVTTHKWEEAFGQIVIESMACGSPVISYNKGGPAEVIKHGDTGFLCEPDNIDSVITAIESIDSIKRARCRQYVEKEFSLEALGNRYKEWLTLNIA